MKQIILFFMLIIPVVGFSQTNDNSDKPRLIFNYTLAKKVDLILINGQFYENVKITFTTTSKINGPGVKVIVEQNDQIIYKHRFNKDYLYYWPKRQAVVVRHPQGIGKVVIYENEDQWLGGINNDGIF